VKPRLRHRSIEVAVFSVICSSLAFVQAPSQPVVEWIDRIGSPSYEAAIAVSVDGDRVASLVNRLRDQLYIFDPDGVLVARHVFELPNFHARDVAVGGGGIFVVGSWRRGGAIFALDRDGSWLWSRRFSPRLVTYEISTVATFRNAVYLGGYRQKRDQDGDAFLRRYDIDGTRRWTRVFGHRRPYEQISGVAVDASGVYATGSTNGVLAPAATAHGDEQVFVRALGPGGELRWTAQFGRHSRDDWSVAVATTGHGIYVIGNSERMSPSPPSSFVARYSRAGERRWLVRWACPLGGHHEATDGAAAAGRIMVSAIARCSLAGGQDVKVEDATVVAVTVAGEIAWIHRFTGPGGSQALGVAADPEAAFVAGQAKGPFLGTDPSGGADAFVLRLLG
jgi:outer membrane protein assembly factor BamB